MRPPESLHWNAYPALIAAILFSGGIVLAKTLAPPLWIAALLTASAVAAALASRRKRLLSLRSLQLSLCVAAALTAAGAVRYVSYYAISSDHVTLLSFDEEVLLTGSIEGPPRWTNWGMRFTMKLESVGTEKRRVSGLLAVTVEAAPAERHGFTACERVEVFGTLKPLPRPRNPGEFDYGRFLARRRVYAVLQAQSVERIGSRLAGPACTASVLRETLRGRISYFVRHDDARAVVEALVLGDRSVVDREVIDRFTRTGLLHLLAVSGLHVMVVGMILYRLLGPTLMRLGLRWRAVEVIRSSITAGMLLTYMLVTGAAPSVVRAVVMAILFTGASVFQRSSNPMNSVGSAALVILAISPSQLFEPGFQLSFAAVAGIIGLKVHNPWIGMRGQVLSGIIVTASATAATLPVVIYHFGHVSLGGLLLNIVAVPVTSATLCSAIAALASGPFSSGAADLFGASTEFLALILLEVAERGDDWLAWSFLRWRVEDAAFPIALGLVLVAIGCRRRARTRWRLASLSLLICCGALTMRLIDGVYKPLLDVLFLDVGQGDAILLRTPDGSAILVDTGVRTPFSDSGKRVLVPVLDHLGISRIHTVVITHPDSDHLGGLPALMRTLPVGRVLTNGVPHTSILSEEVAALHDSLAVPATTVVAGDTVLVDGSVRISVLYPNPDIRGSDPNDSSIILLVAFGETSFLLMGDAPVPAELAVMRRYGPVLRPDVLKLGHHGSATSSSPALISFLRTRGTSISVLSVGARNRYGLPDSSVVRRIRAAGITTYSTADIGAVWLRSDGSTIQRIEWR